MKSREFDESDLVHATEPHYCWKCPGCGASRDNVASVIDEVRGVYMAPRCDRCNTFMAPVNHRPRSPS